MSTIRYSFGRDERISSSISAKQTRAWTREPLGGLAKRQ